MLSRDPTRAATTGDPMRLLLLVLGLMAAVPAAAQSEITASLGSKPLHLPLPSGYCAVDPAQSAEGKLAAIHAQALQPMNQLLGIAMPCDQLTAYRDSQKPFDHYLEFTAQLQNGAPLPRADAGREAYLAELAAQIPHLDGGAPADTVDSPTQSAAVSTKIDKFGLIGQDEAAAYLASVATYNETTLATLSALTAAGGWTVSAKFFRPYVDDGTVGGLLVEARHEARAMIAANGGSIADPAELPPLTTDLKSMTPPHGGSDSGNPLGFSLSRLTSVQMGLIIFALAVVTLALVLLANQRSR